MNVYKLGALFFPNKETERNKEWGDIVVGGDRGDVYMDGAYPDTREHEGEEVPGVYCTGVELHTSEDFTEEEAKEIAEDVVCACYASIKGETFRGKTRWT